MSCKTSIMPLEDSPSNTAQSHTTPFPHLPCRPGTLERLELPQADDPVLRAEQWPTVLLMSLADRELPSTGPPGPGPLQPRPMPTIRRTLLHTIM